MAERAVEGLMGLTIDKVREIVDSDTIIGKPINTPDGTMILPVSKVTLGIASGGSDFGAQKAQFGGGSGTGVSVTPVAFLVIKDGNVRTIQLSNSGDTLDRLITMLPELVDKFNESKKKKKAAAAAEAAAAEEI